ncbi:MAG: hypothetical protein ACRBBP_10500 [Bdellovibrionales bacterium]
MKKWIKYTMLILISGCSGDNTTAGNPLVALSVQATAPGDLSASSFSKLSLNTNSILIDVKNSSGVTVGQLNIQSAKIAIKEIEFELESQQASEEVEFDFKGPFIVNLLENSISPEFPQVELVEGVYNEVKLKIDKIEGDEVDSNGNPILSPADPLFGNSVVVSGLYTGPTSNQGNVSDMSFEMIFDFDDELELTGVGDTSVGFNLESGLNRIILAFRTAKWLDFNNLETNESGMEPAQLEVVGGAISLTVSSVGNNSSIRDVLYKNIKESLDYGKDADGDGVLERNEDDDPDSEDEDDD